jgi:NAD(P)-dependent dehydrogenase (short-subunit alcohol dehydrogenase family)
MQKDDAMNEQLFRLDDKVAIVTGATKGIGKAMARGLAAAGALVVVSSRKQELCDEVAQELQDETGRLSCR